MGGAARNGGRFESISNIGVDDGILEGIFLIRN
jgi:hypothetical protein